MERTKSTLVNNINTQLADNATGEISPQDVRQNMLDIIDSVGNLLVTEEIVTANFSTPATETTIAGIDALSKLGQEGYVTTGSVAVGHSALKQNYQGDYNTAVGAYSLSCNVHGDHNVAVGYAAVGGNSNGTANVGIGDYTLYYSKLGNFNVAIGHGAGYYLDRNTSNKLFIATHPVTEQYVCDNPEGVGLTPLVYGDFATEQFGINVNDLHSYGSLQVSGAISPSENVEFDLGHTNYAFDTTHTRGIWYSENTTSRYDDAALAVVHSGVHAHAGDIDPLTDGVYALGDNDKKWHEIHTYDLYVEGEAYIHSYNSINDCLYDCKTLYLATSGVCDGALSPCGYLDSSQLLGAGLVIPTSGTAGLSDFTWTLLPSGTLDNINLPYVGVGSSKTLEQYTSWGTNVNVELSGDMTHIMASRHLGRGDTFFGGYDEDTGAIQGMLSIDQAGNNYPGLVFTTNDSFVSNGETSARQTTPKARYRFMLNDLVNQTDTNGIDSRSVMIQSLDYRVPASLQIQHGNTNKSGVEFLSQPSGVAKGLYVSTYDRVGTDTHNTMSLMTSDETGGVFGVHNFEGESQLRFPETIINARSNTDAALRVTAENAADVTASLELCGEENCLANAVDFAYNKASGVAAISTYLDSGRIIHTTFDTASGNTIFNNGNVQLGDTDAGILSFRDHASNSVVNTQTGFTRLYSRHVDNKLNQASELVYVDTSGNVIPLSLVTAYSDPLFVDNNNNVFGGSGVPSDRLLITSASGNTALGNNALYGLTEGSEPQGALNTAIGLSAGSGIQNGVGNIAVGTYTYAGAASSGVNNNIVIGNHVSPTSDDNILIGNSLEGSGLPTKTLLIGNSTDILISGDITSHKTSLPSGTFSLLNGDNSYSTDYSHTNITVRGSGDRYGNEQFAITFAGSGGLTNDIFVLDNSNHYEMSNQQDYEVTNPRRPFAHIDGDVRVRGAVRFPDGTSIATGSGISDYQQVLTDLLDTINTQTLEGVLSEDIASPETRFAPTSGIVTTLGGESFWLSNRDTFMRLEEGDYVVANRVLNPLGQQEYRPVWVSNECNACGCGRTSAEET